MYEYAATAIAPNNSGANFDAKNIAVGPSAPPIIAMAEASLSENSKPGIAFKAITEICRYRSLRNICNAVNHQLQKSRQREYWLK